MAAAAPPRSITMVKKRLANGDPCEKCAQTEEMLRRRGVWERIDSVVYADEGDDASPGVELGRRHGVEVAPFFILEFEDGSEAVYTSGMKLLRDHLSQPSVAKAAPPNRAPGGSADDLEVLRDAWNSLDAPAIVAAALERFRARCAVVVSGGEDVVLLDMAVKSGLPFEALFVDTGRHHAETYALLDALPRQFGIEIRSVLPDREALVTFLEAKGQNAFLRDGHEECCQLRRRAPLTRALADFDAWLGLGRLGRELDPARAPSVIEIDALHATAGRSLFRIDPLIHWDNNAVWNYVRKHDVPHNALHDRGYRFIGCEPCTRAIRPDQADAEGLWWWEAEERRRGESATREGEGI